MKAYASKDKNTIFYMGMSEEERNRCLEDKKNNRSNNKSF
jgi:hypothetical protein